MEIKMLKELNELSNFIDNKKIKEFNALMNSIDKDEFIDELYEKVDEINAKNFNDRSDEDEQLHSMIRKVEDFEYNKRLVYSVPLPENDVSNCFMFEDDIKKSYYRGAFKSFKKSNTSFKEFSKKGFIYATTYLDANKDKEGEYLVNHLKLRRFINSQKYTSGHKMKYIETCGIKDGNSIIALYIPIEWEHYYYNIKVKKLNVGLLEDEQKHCNETHIDLPELAHKVLKEFNLKSVLYKIPEEEEIFKLSENGKESVGIISNIDELENYLGGYDYFGFTYCENHIHAMSLPGHILVR